MNGRDTKDARWTDHWPGLALILSGILLAALLAALHGRLGLPLALGPLLDPALGVFGQTRERAGEERGVTVRIAGLDGPVNVLYDERAVPHIFAASDRDAVRALGYVVARDRLFQMDFVTRVASGRLSEVVGAGAVETDRFLRRTGMREGAMRTRDTLRARGGLEWDVLNWYAEGVNAYVRTLRPAAYPFEMRLFGTAPEPWSPLKTLLLLQYMAYDLSFRSDDTAYGALRGQLGAVYDTLYPQFQPYAVPIVDTWRGGAPDPSESRRRAPENLAARRLRDGQERLAGLMGEGFRHGKGSNNWAVSGARSTTGAPILAGDMHLGLSLPAIWYEVHLVTPTMNTYGVTIPGAPLPVEAFNDHLAWAFTNTGSDQIDHYVLRLDSTGTRYAFNGRWPALDVRVDTIYTSSGRAVTDTVRWSHFGPVVTGEDGTAVAIRWTAHEVSHTMAALWGMNHARTYAEFEAATQDWDTPMQNILVATRAGEIAIRSTGYLPVRAGGSGAGLLDGTTDRFAWTGRVAFDQLPHSRNPERGYLTSTNQMPAGRGYPYYLGHDWRDVFRSVRIDSLLRGKPRHSPDDFRRYQADQHAVQIDFLRPSLERLPALTARADTLRRRLLRWNGDAAVDRAEPLALWHVMRALRALAWDEPAFEGRPAPSDPQLLGLLRDAPALSAWDVAATADVRETAPVLLARALDAAADTLAQRYGRDWTRARWGDHQRIVFRHLTRADALRALWRGPYPYGGFEATLSPASAPMTTHSASWRVVVDLSGPAPRGYGVYPGGQSGDPASARYADFLPFYLGFHLYPLYRPTAVERFDTSHLSRKLTLR
jgi:penicillin G amidase